MLLLLSFFHDSTFKCFAEKHQELSSAAHHAHCEILGEKVCQKSRMGLMGALVALSDNTGFIYLCSFYANFPSSTLSEKPVAVELQAKISNFS